MNASLKSHPLNTFSVADSSIPELTSVVDGYIWCLLSALPIG